MWTACPISLCPSVTNEGRRDLICKVTLSLFSPILELCALGNHRVQATTRKSQPGNKAH